MAFFIPKNKIKIKKGESVAFPITFIPLERDNYHCKLIFCDPLVGEFQHEIVGEVLLPGYNKNLIY
jgi:hypothetical protein